MRAKSEELAKQFEAKSRDALATLEKLSEADWKKVTEAEKWSVGVTAHHLASVLEAVSGMIKAVVAKQAPGDLSMALIDGMNARAREGLRQPAPGRRRSSCTARAARPRPRRSAG